MTEFKLTQSERESPLWVKLRAYVESRIAVHQAQNENDKSEVETAKLRGRIREARAFLELANDMPEINSPGAKK